MNEGRNHLTTEQLLDYIERRLAPDRVAVVEEHLTGGCNVCQEEMAWLVETVNLMVSNVWVDPPVRLRTAARRLYRQQFNDNRRPAFSLAEWLGHLLTPRPRLALAGVAVLALIVLGALLIQLWFGQMANPEAEIAAASGTVQVQQADSAGWDDLETDSALQSGDQIRTGQDSSVIVTFPDNSRTLLDPRTELAILRMDARSDGSSRVIILRQDFGRTENMVQPSSSSASRFEIHTPSAVVRVRGTAFTVDVDRDGATAVAVVEGRVEVIAQNMTIALDPGQGAMVAPGLAPVLVDVPAPALSPLLAQTPLPPNAAGTRQFIQPGGILSSATPSSTPTGTRGVTRTPSPTPTPTWGNPLATLPPLPTSPPSYPPDATATNPPLPTEPSATGTPAVEPTATDKVPPGQTKTPQPPGQTKTPNPPGGGTNNDHSSGSNSRGRQK